MISLEELLADWVRKPSVNPLFAGDRSGAAGESLLASAVERSLVELGMETRLVLADDLARPSVVGRIPGRGGGRSLMINGHLDTVGVESYRGDPFAGASSDGRLFGRGAYDMKAGLVAGVGALARLVESGKQLRGDVLFSAVADEEAASFGARAVAEQFPVDGVVITEPTDLQPVLAHKGFVWLKIYSTGFACHGSLADRGIDANRHMSYVFDALSRLEGERANLEHALLGRPSLHVGQIAGGSGPSVYSSSCEMTVELRTLPGESAWFLASRLRDLITVSAPESIAARLEVEVVLERPAIETPANSSLGARLLHSLAARSMPSLPRGVPYWTDGGIFSSESTEVVLFGPAGDGAHEDLEWVDIASMVTSADILFEVMCSYCS